MNSIIVQLCLIFTIPLPILGSLFNGTCGIKGICSNPMEVKLNQGMNELKFYWTVCFFYCFVGFSSSANECLKQCQRTEGCQWSSFDERYQSCNLFDKCLDVDNCEECTTNHVDCMNPSCDIPGYCEVGRYSFAFYI